jgi:phosphate transport system substrate-binding protein
MNITKKLALGLIITFFGAEARESLYIVSPYSLAPFSNLVIKKMTQEKKNLPSTVEIKSSEYGFKKFCAGGGLNTPDIINSDRRMKKEEFNQCTENGVKDITEAIIGYDATVFVQNISTKVFNISKKELMLAILDKVPSQDGISLIDNPYKKWSDISPKLPRKNIMIYTLKKDTVSFSIITNKILTPIIEEMIVYNDIEDPYVLRDDNTIIKSDTKEALITTLVQNRTAIGLMNYSLSTKYKSKLQTLLIEKVSPSINSISTKKYPLSNKLYFYSKNKHKKQIHSMQIYIENFMDKKMIGRKGTLSKLGLIPLNKHEMFTKIKYMREGKQLILKDLNYNFFHLAL